jgi:endonuclease III-like uncharacterized protein
MDKYDIEQRVKSAENSIKEIKSRIESLDPYRNQVIEEVAQEVEKMTGFGKDTIDSFSIYIRSLKA